jgi:hypothetical protein
MSAEHFAEWYRRQGHRVIHTAHSYWFDAGPRVFQAFPFGWLIEPTEKELRTLMLKNGMLSLRYSTPLEACIGKVSYHVTLTDPYSLELLRSQARNGVKRGLARCNVEQVPFERIASEGWNLQRDTLERQGRANSMDESQWRRVCLSAVGLDGFEAWSAIVDGELAACLIVCQVDDIFYVPYAFSHSKYLNLYVNNALFFSVSCNLLARPSINGIFFTVQSLDAPKSVDDFKFRMGFNAKAVKQRVTFHPLLQPLVNKYTHKALESLLKRFPERASLAKVEGMIRFYLDGNLAPDQQEWPDCIKQLNPEPQE